MSRYLPCWLLLLFQIGSETRKIKAQWRALHREVDAARSLARSVARKEGPA
jgi:hypothetical protein